MESRIGVLHGTGPVDPRFDPLDFRFDPTEAIVVFGLWIFSTDLFSFLNSTKELVRILVWAKKNAELLILVFDTNCFCFPNFFEDFKTHIVKSVSVQHLIH